jgi:hypothetical protein
VVARLVIEHGFAPAFRRFLLSPADRREFWTAASLPDRVGEVAVYLPGEGFQLEILGHGLASFQHFQHATGAGYCWRDDSSLTGVGEAIAPLVMRAAGMRVMACQEGEHTPLTGLAEDSPISIACAEQQRATLGDFRFPSAGMSTEFWHRSVCYWLSSDNGPGVRRGLGYLLHFIHDALVPHHAWGWLLHGHAAFEDALELEWTNTMIGLEADPAVLGVSLTRVVGEALAELRRWKTIGELCAAGGAWSRATFGRHARDVCPGDDATRISIQAIAASIRALEIAFGD